MNSMVRRPVFWVIVALVVLVLYKAPADASAIVRLAGHVVVVLVKGIGAFVGTLSKA
jgi:hypothetical protein